MKAKLNLREILRSAITKQSPSPVMKIVGAPMETPIPYCPVCGCEDILYTTILASRHHVLECQGRCCSHRVCRTDPTSMTRDWNRIHRGADLPYDCSEEFSSKFQEAYDCLGNGQLTQARVLFEQLKEYLGYRNPAVARLKKYLDLQTPAGATHTNEELTLCDCDDDGYCEHPQCPQLRDNEPEATGRWCPLLKDPEFY